jgi:phosphate transport system substrate-binding protein
MPDDILSHREYIRENMNMKKTLWTMALATALAVSSVAAFAGSKNTLKVAGSTTVLPVSQIWADAYMHKHTDVTIIVSGGGTGVGFSMLQNGLCDIANASREAQRKEIDTAKAHNSKLVATKLGKDGIAIIAHRDNNVTNLTIDQIGAIYSGKVSSWKQVGGNTAKAVVIVGRDTSSGTYGFFQEAVLGGSAYTKEMLCLPSNVAVADEVAQTEGAIGYVGMAFADEYVKAGKVKIIAVSKAKGEPGMVPSEATVKSGKYPLFRYLYAYTLGKPSGLVKDFLNFGLSSQGQALVTKAGYLPMN